MKLFIFFFVISTFFVSGILFIKRILYVVEIEQQSMRPTLSAGDRVLVNRLWVNSWLQKGDIVLIDIQKKLYITKPVIKRIVGLLGDKFVIHADKTYAILTSEESLNSSSDKDGQVALLPEGCCFVCGDNSENSVDSRTWGPVPISAIKGIVVAASR